MVISLIIAFSILQALDIHSTLKTLKNPNIEEANPIWKKVLENRNRMYLLYLYKSISIILVGTFSLFYCNLGYHVVVTLFLVALTSYSLFAVLNNYKNYRWKNDV